MRLGKYAAPAVDVMDAATTQLEGEIEGLAETLAVGRIDGVLRAESALLAAPCADKSLATALRVVIEVGQLLEVKLWMKMLRQPFRSPVIRSPKSDPAAPQSENTLLPEMAMVLSPLASAAFPLAMVAVAMAAASRTLAPRPVVP